MSNVILEIILSSDEDSSPQVDLSVNSKEHAKYQNTGARKSSNNEAVSTILPTSNLKSTASISNNLMPIAKEKNVKDPVHTIPLKIKQVPNLNDRGGSKSKNSVNAHTVLATNSNKSFKNSSAFKADSTPLTQHKKKSSKGVDFNVNHVTSSSKPLVQKSPRPTARKSMHSFSENYLKQSPVLDKTKWIINNNDSPNQVESNVVSDSRKKEETETIRNSNLKNSFTPGSTSSLSVTPVLSAQQTNKTCVVNDVKDSISIIKLGDHSGSQRKARKSLPNSKCTLPEHLKRTLSKAGVSITNISKDTTNNNDDVPSNANSSSSGLQTAILNSHNISNTQDNINEAQQRKSSCDTNSKSALRIINVDSQKNARTDLKSVSDFNFAKSNEISLSVNPASNQTDMDQKNHRRQIVKPSQNLNVFLRSEKETTQMNKNPTLSKTSSIQLHEKSEISIIRVPIKGLNATSSNKKVKSSTKASDPIKPTLLSQAPQMNVSQKQFVSILRCNSKKQKLQNSEEQINLQPKVNHKQISTSRDTTNNIILVPSNTLNLSRSSSQPRIPLGLSSNSSCTTNKGRITSLKKSLVKLESKTTKSLSKAKSQKKTNSSGKFREMNTQNLKIVESVSTDIEMKNISIRKVADKQDVSAQETTNSKLSLSTKLMENCVTNMKEDQTSKQRTPTKQVTSPKLSLKRKTNIVSEDDHSAKKSKLECIEEWNRPSTSAHVDIVHVELNGDFEERIPWESSDDSSTKLKKLLDFCMPIMKKQEYYEPGEENKISKSMLKSLDSTKPSYASSSEFNDLLLDTFKDIKTKPQELFQHLIKIKGILAAYKDKGLKAQRSSISHGTSENPKVQPTSLKSSTPYKTLEISKIQPTPLQSTIPHTISEKPKVQPKTPELSISHSAPEFPNVQPITLQSAIPLITLENPKVQSTMESSISHSTPEIPNVQPKSLQSPISLTTPENPEVKPTLESSISRSTHEIPNVQPVSLISTINHNTSEKIEPTSVKSSIVHNTPENPEVEPTSVKSSTVHNTPENPEVEPTSVKSSTVHNTPENPEVEPTSVKPSAAHDTPENPEVEPTSVKSSTVHNKPEYLEVQPIHLLPTVNNTVEKVKPVSVKSPIVCNTSEKPEVQRMPLLSSTVCNTLEYAEPTYVKSSIELNASEVQSILSISVHDTSEKVEPISVKSPRAFNRIEISNAQTTSSIAHNASEKVECSSPSVVQSTELKRTCESSSGFSKTELPKMVCDLPHIELEKPDIPRSVIRIDKELNFGEGSHSRPRPRSGSFEAKLNERIKCLERFIEKLDKKIKKLAARDFSLEEMDGDDTAYLQEDRYKRKLVKVWDKLCSLQKCSARFGRATDKRFVFTGTRFDLVNKAIERFINKRKPSDRFPNFNEIVDVIKKVNEVHNLGLPARSIETTARDAFTDVGLELKKRRIKDYNKDFGCSLIDNVNFDDDPADHDTNLNKVLNDSVCIGEKKIAEIIDKYANENVEDLETVEDENIEGDVCETSFEEVKENDNKLPDTDPANSSDDEAKDSTIQVDFMASKRKSVDDVVSDASTEPDSSRVADKDSLTVPEVFCNSPVIFNSDIEIIEYPSETMDELISSSPDLPDLSEILSQPVTKTDKE